MMNMKNIFKIVLLSSIFVQLSCKKFLEIDPPKESLVQETIFKSDDIATSAVTGIYRNMAENGFASGDQSSIASICGVSCDELVSYNTILNEFYENQISPNNAYLNGTLYFSPYQLIYTANATLEGLSASSGVTPPVKAQLRGEALFIRAFIYFYLVNLYGAVPLQLTTDHRVNEIANRAPVEQIYQQIINDLKDAESLISENYVTTERVRPNKAAVQALLARTYLYLQDWENAEKYASLVIEKTNLYNIVGLDGIFLKNSSEAIWQLMPRANSNSLNGNLFILVATPIYVSLRKDFVDNVFEPNDKRKTSWIQIFTNSTGTYYYPFKYKVRSSTTVTEYSMVLRLAEQYLIRAESRINQNKVSLGIQDINIIRQRPLSTTGNLNPISPLSSSLNKSDALLAVERERRVELFSEWGHRWLDLKRTGKTNSVLSLIKPRWEQTDVLYPIPYNETSRNSSIKQNPGY